jgi:hypothetical protein
MIGYPELESTFLYIGQGNCIGEEDKKYKIYSDILVKSKKLDKNKRKFFAHL